MAINPKMKNFFQNLREYIWPLLDPETEEQKEKDKKREQEYGTSDAVLKKIEHITDDKYVEEFTRTCKELYDSEETRLQTIESKAALLLGAEGLIITLVVSFETTVVKSLSDKSIFLFLLITLLVVLAVIYFFTSALYTLRVLARAHYHQVNESEIADAELSDRAAYLKRLGSLYIAKRVNNYSVINDKVDNMVMSQEFFRRGIRSLFVSSILYILSISSGIIAPLLSSIPHILKLITGIVVLFLSIILRVVSLFVRAFC